MGAWPGTRSRFEHWIAEQEQQLGCKVTLITGHSAGAVYGSAVFKTAHIARVFFNGHRASDHPDAIYLSTGGDPLTYWHLLKCNDLSEAARNLCVVGPGGHTINDFVAYLKDKTWDGLPLGMSALQPFLLNTSPYALFNAPLSPEQLNAALEDITQKKAVLEKAANTREFIDNAWAAAREIASQMQLISSMRSAERAQLRQGNSQLHEAELRSRDLRENSPVLHMDLAVGIHNRLHPAHLATLVEEARQLAAEYRDASAILRENLDQSHKLDFALLEQESKLGKLNDRQQAAYKKLLSSHQEIGRLYRRIETVLALSGSICTLTGHSHVASGFQLANSAVNYFHNRALDRQAGIQDQHARGLNDMARVQDKVAQARGDNVSRYDSSLQSYRQLVHDVCSNPYALPVNETRGHLDRAVTDFTRAHETAAEHTKTLAQRQQDVQRQIDAKAAEAANLKVQERTPGNSKKRKGELNKKIDRANTEVAQLQATLTTLTQPLQSAQQAEEALLKDLNKVKAVKVDWEEHTPFQLRCESLIGAEARYMKWLAKTGHKIGKNKLSFTPINKKVEGKQNGTQKTQCRIQG